MQTNNSLVQHAKNGNNDAKNMLIQENSPLIKSVIKRFRNKGVEYDDLYQLGCMGFLKAINNYNPEFNVKFSTYAVPLIAGEVKRFLRDDGYIKISRSLKSLSIQINKFIDEYYKTHIDSPKISEIAKHFNIDETDVVCAMECSKLPISIYEKTDEDPSKSRTIIDKLPDEHNEDDMLNKIMLKDIISSLEPRDKKIIILRYFRDKTQGEVARMLNVSQVQVSRLEIKILQQLKQKMEK